MLEPKDIEINGKQFVISKFPAVAGREILSKYPLSNVPKLGDYKVSEEVMLKLMSYVGVRLDGRAEPQLLTTVTLINNHTQDWETLIKLEWAMLEYNCSFFQNGKSSDFLKKLGSLAQQKITEILTDLSAKSYPGAKPPSKN